MFFEWERLRLEGSSPPVAGGGERLLARLEEVGGEIGLRPTVGYRGVGVLGVSAKRGDRGAFETWERAVDAVLARLDI